MGRGDFSINQGTIANPSAGCQRAAKQDRVTPGCSLGVNPKWTAFLGGAEPPPPPFSLQPAKAQGVLSTLRVALSTQTQYWLLLLIPLTNIEAPEISCLLI